MSDTAEKSKLAQPLALTPAVLSGIAAIGTAAQQQLAAQQLEASGKRFDEAEVPGGRFLGADGKEHDAHGNVFGKDGTVESFAALTPQTVIASAGSEAELAAIEAQIAKRREALQADADAREAAAAGPDYEGMSRVDIEAEAERRGVTVKGSGANGNVLKSDIVRALQKADKTRQ